MLPETESPEQSLNLVLCRGGRPTLASSLPLPPFTRDVAAPCFRVVTLGAHCSKMHLTVRERQHVYRCSDTDLTMLARKDRREAAVT